jgi:uncharacterized oxidoreductase
MSRFNNLWTSARTPALVLANEAPLKFGFSVGAIMKVQPDRARQFCTNVLLALDTPEATARTISSHLVEADMKNVRSHGVIRLVRYAEQIESGYIDNKAPIDIRQVAPGMLHVDANKNWGIVALDAMVPELERMAQANGVAAGALVNCAHTGRIGAFSEALARRFMWGMVFGGGANRHLHEVAPHGGAKGVFDTNPYAFSLPMTKSSMASADFATAATAQGKVLVYRTNKKPLPPGWVIDKDGKPSVNPEDLYDGGALLTSGEQKGSAMALIAELFGEAVLGTPHELNWFVIAVDLNRFTDQAAYFSQALSLQTKIENCPPAAGVDKVRWPGQPEVESEAAASNDGIEYSSLELDRLATLGSRLNIVL